MKCSNCGAPLEAGTEVCPYCGSTTAYGESLVEEKAAQKRDAEKRKRLENLPAMKFVSGAFIPVLYFLTFTGYAPYWYATRMKTLDELGSTKVPKWAVALYGLLWFAMIMLPGKESDLGFSPEGEQPIFNTVLGLIIALSIWLAFKVRNILQEYAAQTLERSVALSAVAPSNGLLILFGPMYLQYQVNKMISMELLSPKI